jgi:hypothetical protein
MAGLCAADGQADPDRCLARLEEMWRQTVDLIVLLSMAYHDATSPSDDGEGDGLAVSAVPVAGQDPDAGLLSRVLAAHETLAEIEEAIDRLKAGGYGICERCEQPMPAAWLAESPQVRYCPGCALEQLRWQPRSAGPGAAGRPARRRLRLIATG